MSDDWLLNNDGTATFVTNEHGSITINLNNFIGGVGPSYIDISKNHSNYHEYGDINPLGISVNEAPIELVQAVLRLFPTPFGPGFAGPGFVYHTDDNGVVTNYTQQLHLLDPGLVQREIVIVDGEYHVKTVGIGIGDNPFNLNEDLADEVWGLADFRIRKRLELFLNKGTNFDVIIPPQYGETIDCFFAGTLIELADGSHKPIEEIEPGDEVAAFDLGVEDGRGALEPARVVRVFRKQVPEILDFHGLMVTPGHVTLCGDGPDKGKCIPIIDVLKADGAAVDRDGKLVRAATNLPVGSPGDAFVQVAWLAGPHERRHRHGRLRLGTLVMREDGTSWRIGEALAREGYELQPDGLIAKPGEEPHPLYWYGELPKPEDYVLARSRLFMLQAGVDTSAKVPAVSVFQ